MTVNPLKNWRAMAAVASLLLCALATAQTASWKTFNDPQNGVSFRYPATWPRFESYGSALAIKDHDRVVVAFGRINDGGTKRQPAVNTISFAYSILEAKNASSCQQRSKIPSDQEPPRAPDSPIINGLQFAHGSAMSAGAGHGTENDAYTIFRNGRCYGFEIVADTENTDHLKSKGEAADPALILNTVKISRLIEGQLPAAKNR